MRVVWLLILTIFSLLKICRVQYRRWCFFAVRNMILQLVWQFWSQWRNLFHLFLCPVKTRRPIKGHQQVVLLGFWVILRIFMAQCGACFTRSWNHVCTAACITLILIILYVRPCMSRVTIAILHLALVLLGTFGQYILTLVRCAFPNNCFATYVSCSLEVLSVLLLGTRRKIDASVESIVVLSCWSEILVRSNDSIRISS